MSEPVRVVGLCGSLRPGSHTRQALAVALEGADAEGADTELIDLRDYDLPLCDGNEPDEGYGDDVERLRRTVADAHGIVLGTPEYHGGYSGVLKNALDLMGFDEFEGKMIGLVGVSGGAMGGQNALQALRGIGRALHAWVVPSEAAVPHAWKAFDDDGAPKDDRTAARLRKVGQEVARYAHLHSPDHAREFVEAWEEAIENPGGPDR